MEATNALGSSANKIDSSDQNYLIGVIKTSRVEFYRPPYIIRLMDYIGLWTNL